MAPQDPIESPPPPPLPMAPPTQAGPIAAAPARSKWPTVIGIIAILLGAFGLLGLLGQLAMTVVPNPPGAASQPAMPEPPQIVRVIYTPIVVLLALLQLVAGLGLLSRRRWSVRALVVWAIADLLMILVGLVGTAINMPAFQQQMMQQNPAMPPGATGVFGVFFGVMMCFGAAFALAPPIFVLIWFHRAAIQDEVKTWA